MFLVAGRHPGRARRAPDPDDGPGVRGRARRSSTFEGCRVPADAVLGEVGLGYRYAQVRLAPARLTHCMRWLGLARRVARHRARPAPREREAFGAPLLEQGMVQALVADSVIDIEASRGLIRTLRRGARRRRARHARVVGREGVRVRGGRARRRPRAADLRRRSARATTCRSPATHARCAPSASTTGRARRTAGRSPAAPRAAASASGERPGRRRRHAGGGGRAAAAAARRAPAARGACSTRSGLGRGPLAATRIGAGHSNATFLLERGGERMVLRRPPRPPLPPSAHDMLREARVLSALAAAARACRACSPCADDPDVLGVPFYVMEELRRATS